MKISCSLKITNENIALISKSVNPENNPQDPKSTQQISFSLENDTITYFFNNFEKITTLRLTLEDLLSHLSFAQAISNDVLKKVKKDRKV